ncbi:hypothetical protein ACFQ68_13520 [Amycolatopsis japonica]|uniref:hypothetical protein n=1 Tax=Amycolatopsis japonica TaxID=208439 RepID=UPI00366C36C9
MANTIDPDPEFTHSKIGTDIVLSWSERPNRPRHSFIVNSETGETTGGDGSAVSSADGRVLQQALASIGKSALGRTVFDRYSR